VYFALSFELTDVQPTSLQFEEPSDIVIDQPDVQPASVEAEDVIATLIEEPVQLSETAQIEEFAPSFLDESAVQPAPDQPQETPEASDQPADQQPADLTQELLEPIEEPADQQFAGLLDEYGVTSIEEPVVLTTPEQIEEFIASLLAVPVALDAIEQVEEQPEIPPENPADQQPAEPTQETSEPIEEPADQQPAEQLEEPSAPLIDEPALQQPAEQVEEPCEPSVEELTDQQLEEQPEENLAIPVEMPANQQEAEQLEETPEQPAEQLEEVEGERPTSTQLKQELDRENYKRKYRRVLRSTVSLLTIAAAVAVLIVTLWMPVLQIYGNSMNPTLENGEVVVLVKTTNYKTGDLIAFYYNNKILVKRVIAQAGDWVDIDEDGNVSVNGEPIDEPYVTEKALGECDLTLPYQVPDERVFVMGDHRSVSVDSRSSQVGCVSKEQVVGKLILRVWPISQLGIPS
jgi:signal peptidase I